VTCLCCGILGMDWLRVDLLSVRDRPGYVVHRIDYCVQMVKGSSLLNVNGLRKLKTSRTSRIPVTDFRHVTVSHS
jgi:hypothetical protein